MDEREGHLAVLQTIRSEEKVISEDKIMAHKVESAEKQSKRLQDQRSRLGDRLAALQAKLAAKQERNSILSQNQKYLDDSNYDPVRNSFFKVLRCLEAEYEREVSERDGMISEIKGLKGSISEFSAIRKKRMRQIAQLKAQETDARSRAVRLETEYVEELDVLDGLEKQAEILGDECEQVKQGVIETAQEMRQFTEADRAKLTGQKRILEESIKSRKEKLEQMKKQHARVISQNRIGRKQREKTMKQISSPVAWMSERTALIGKIKKAQGDLEQLKIRDRGMARATENMDKKMTDLNCSDDEIKAAIVCEMRTFQQELSPFQQDAIALESEYNEELQRELQDVIQSTALVEQYHSSIVALLKRQDSIAAQGDRINALSNELNELRADM